VDQPSRPQGIFETMLTGPSRRRLSTTFLWASCALAVGCWSDSPDVVVVYTALDEEFSSTILDDFHRETSVEAWPKFDSEATKTVGLANALMAQGDHPSADVFWNNEILNTLRLRDAGLLAAYDSPAGRAYPAMFQAQDHTWFGFAARARVLLVNTEMVDESQRPRSIHDLADPRWQGKVGLAKPLFGTTATHAACLFAAWGDDEARAYFMSLKQNDVQILASNKQVAVAVAAGQLAFGLTDTDDAIIEVEQGFPVEIVYPDRGEGELGTLFIPNSLAVMKNAPHPEAARKLVDFLLSPAVEGALARGRSAQIPLQPGVTVDVRVETPATVHPMDVDFGAAAAVWDTVAEFMRDEFTVDE